MHGSIPAACIPQFSRYVAYNVPEGMDVPLEVVIWVLQLFDV